MRQWHCYVGGQQYGPVSDDVLREWTASGRLKPTDNVWTEGMEQWLPAEQVSELFDGVTAPPPLPATCPAGSGSSGGSPVSG